MLLAGATTGEAWSEAAVRSALRERLKGGETPSQAARTVAGESGWRRNEVYRLALEAG